MMKTIRRGFLQLVALLPFVPEIKMCIMKENTEGAAGFGEGLTFPGYFLATPPQETEPAAVTIRGFRAIVWLHKIFGGK